MPEGTIGIFDSGLGGLSVMQEVRRRLPAENLLYFGDCLHAPYGDRSEDYITDRVFKISEFLQAHHAKAIVVACNTATAASVDKLRAVTDIPVIGIEPALKPAIQSTKTGSVGVLATTRTINSRRYHQLLTKYNADKGVNVLSIPCPGLMDCVENNHCETIETQHLLEKFLAPIQEAGCDIVVLGCTHYPFLTKTIRKIIGNDIRLIDPSPAVARQLANQLTKQGTLNTDDRMGSESFYVTGLTDATAKTISALWGHPVKIQNTDI